jgi:transposase
MVQDKLGNNHYALFLDNLRVHHGRIVGDFARSQELHFIFNAPYSPQFNAIELLWRTVKHYYRKLKLKSLIDSKAYDSKALI